MPGCYIGGVHFSPDAFNGPCQACRPMESTSQWTFEPVTTLCDDTNACTYLDHCVAGTCTGTVYECFIRDCVDASECDGFGGCIETPAFQGTQCMDDGDLCTTDRCDGFGTCEHMVRGC